jgi:hypothetical protein
MGKVWDSPQAHLAVRFWTTPAEGTWQEGRPAQRVTRVGWGPRALRNDGAARPAPREARHSPPTFLNRGLTTLLKIDPNE